MLKVRIETKNAAFEGNLKSEVARCLKEVIKNIECWSHAGDHSIEGTIYDINGGNVGKFKLTK